MSFLSTGSTHKHHFPDRAFIQNRILTFFLLRIKLHRWGQARHPPLRSWEWSPPEITVSSSSILREASACRAAPSSTNPHIRHTSPADCLALARTGLTFRGNGFRIRRHPPQVVTLWPRGAVGGRTAEFITASCTQCPFVTGDIGKFRLMALSEPPGVTDTETCSAQAGLR